MKLWLYHPDVAPEHDFTKNVPKSEVQKFTALQLGCLWALWSLKESKWGTFHVPIPFVCSISWILVHVFPCNFVGSVKYLVTVYLCGVQCFSSFGSLCVCVGLSWVMEVIYLYGRGGISGADFGAGTHSEHCCGPFISTSTFIRVGSTITLLFCRNTTSAGALSTGSPTKTCWNKLSRFEILALNGHNTHKRRRLV